MQPYESIGTKRETDRELYSQRTKAHVTVAKAIGVDGGLAPGEYFRNRKRDTEYQNSDSLAGSGSLGAGIPNHSAFDRGLEPGRIIWHAIVSMYRSVCS